MEPQLTKDQLQAIEQANAPLIEQETNEESSYSWRTSAFTIIGFISSWIQHGLLSAFLFAVVFIGILLLGRINVLAIQKQIEINTKAVLVKGQPEDNVYQKFVNVLNWFLLGTFTLAFFALFFR